MQSFRPLNPKGHILGTKKGLKGDLAAHFGLYHRFEISSPLIGWKFGSKTISSIHIFASGARFAISGSSRFEWALICGHWNQYDLLSRISVQDRKKLYLINSHHPNFQPIRSLGNWNFWQSHKWGLVWIGFLWWARKSRAMSIEPMSARRVIWCVRVWRSDCNIPLDELSSQPQKPSFKSPIFTPSNFLRNFAHPDFYLMI